MGNNDMYLEFVQNEAKKQGKLFILDSGEGNDYIDPITGWYIEDLSGWLIEQDMQQEFVENRKNKKEYEVYSDNYVFAKWKRNHDGRIVVDFVTYPNQSITAK